MKDQKLVHIENKLYEAKDVKKCPNCNRLYSTTTKGEVTLLDEKAQVTISCNCGGHDVVICFERVKPEWVHLGINGKKMKAESIQTCSERWCQKEFQVQSEKEHIQYDRAEQWHVPVQCPYCYKEHWINLYELDEY